MNYYKIKFNINNSVLEYPIDISDPNLQSNLKKITYNWKDDTVYIQTLDYSLTTGSAVTQIDENTYLNDINSILQY